MSALSTFRTATVQRLALPWALSIRSVCVTLGIVSLVVFVAGRATGGQVPGGDLGVGLGIAATAALAAVMAYSIRRSMPHVRAFGRTRPYLEIHVYGGGLFFLLVLLHTGGGLPSGAMDTMLWATTVWVVLTGAIGLGLQNWLPKVLRSNVATEINLARIPEIVAELQGRAENEAAQGGARLRQFHADRLAGVLAEARPRGRYFLGLVRDPYGIEGAFERLSPTLSTEDQPRLHVLRDIYRSKIDADVHLTLQRGLRVWLVLHLPAAMVMIGILMLHIFLALYY